MLIVEHLTFRFSGKPILDNVSFSLASGKLTCILGGNGTGKTTLFNVISGFLKPESGNVWCGERNLNQLDPFQISRLGVGRTFQDLRLIPKLSVRENILLAIPNHPGEQLTRALLPDNLNRVRDSDDRHRADSILDDYYLSEHADQPASELSFGQQKLLTLACCVALDANILLLDEPVAGISPEYSEQIVQRLANLKASGKTILLIEHQPEFLEQTGDRFLFLETGQIHAFETFSNLRDAPATQHVLI